MEERQEHRRGFEILNLHPDSVSCCGQDLLNVVREQQSIMLSRYKEAVRLQPRLTLLTLFRGGGVAWYRLIESVEFSLSDARQPLKQLEMQRIFAFPQLLPLGRKPSG